MPLLALMHCLFVQIGQAKQSSAATATASAATSHETNPSCHIGVADGTFACVTFTAHAVATTWLGEFRLIMKTQSALGQKLEDGHNFATLRWGSSPQSATSTKLATQWHFCISNMCKCNARQPPIIDLHRIYGMCRQAIEGQLVT